MPSERTLRQVEVMRAAIEAADIPDLEHPQERFCCALVAAIEAGLDAGVSAAKLHTYIDIVVAVRGVIAIKRALS